MMRDNQGRELLRLPTTMRLAFEAAFSRPRPVRAPYDPHLMGTLGHCLRSNHGYRRVPAWTVTKRQKPTR